jgi:hypothetical protein
VLSGILVVVLPPRSTAWAQRRCALLQLAALCTAARYLLASIKKSLASTTARSMRSPPAEKIFRRRLQIRSRSRGAARLPLQRR